MTDYERATKAQFKMARSFLKEARVAGSIELVTAYVNMALTCRTLAKKHRAAGKAAV